MRSSKKVKADIFESTDEAIPASSAMTPTTVKVTWMGRTDDTIIELLLELTINGIGNSESFVGDGESGELYCIPSYYSRG